MHLFIKSGKYIAGIFKDTDRAAVYAETMPTEGFSVSIIGGLDYPFFIVENVKGSESIFTATTNTKDHIGTIYTITGDYEPTIPWADQMGSLPHHHPDE